MSIKITQYKWEGSWGPFKIKTPCGECTVTEGVIRSVLKSDFPDENISYEILPWLNNWWKIIFKGGWHAPITLVNGEIISQGTALDRGLLSYHIRKELVKGYSIPQGANVVFSKENCGYCVRAKEMLKNENISYEKRDIIKNPLFAHQFFHLTKQFFPKNKLVTTPQVWLDGKYIGNHDELAVYLNKQPSKPMVCSIV